MKKLNRILALSAAAALALSLTACSGGPSGTADTPAGGSSNTPAAGETYKVAVIKPWTRSPTRLPPGWTPSRRKTASRSSMR